MSESAWEKSKENIQPLSGGRKMTSLNQSLRNDSATDLDSETQLSIEKLESNINDYRGDDPIEPWIQYISFLQQHRLNEQGKYNSKFKEVLLTCVKKFMVDPRYKNDKRFIEIYLKSVKGVATVRQISLIKTVLSRGIGASVAKIYTTLAELYETNSQNNFALDIIRDGLQRRAEPRDVLEEYETNLEFRVARQLAKTMKQGPETGGDARLFGSSVPLDYKMEAASVRVDLPPASSSNAVPVTQKLDKVSVFRDAENANPGTSNGQLRGSFDPVREMQQIGHESENMINPTKWNTPGAEMSEPIVPHFEKIQIYHSDEEDSVVISESSKRKVMPKGVLAERKLEDVADFVEVKISVAPGDAQGSGSGVGSNIPAGLTFSIPSRSAPRAPAIQEVKNAPESELEMKRDPGRNSSLEPSGTSVTNSSSSGPFSTAPYYEARPNPRANEFKNPPVPVPPPAQKFAKMKGQSQKPAVAAPVVAQKPVGASVGVDQVISMYRKEQLERDGREISFEQLRAEAYLKRLAATDEPTKDTNLIVPVGKDHASSSGDETARELEVLRGEFKAYKEESTKSIAHFEAYKQESTKAIEYLEDTVTQLRQTLESACKVWATTMANTKVLKDEVAALKLKNLEPPSHHGTGLANHGDFVQVQQVPNPPMTFPEDEDDKMDIENRTVDVYCKRQLLKYASMCGTSREPFTTIETYQDAQGKIANISIDVIPASDITEAVFNKEDNFNVTNLTHALNFQPKPMHSSSPDKKRDPELYRSEYGDEEEDKCGDLGSRSAPYTPYTKRNTFNQTLQEVAQNLSTIQETSKERSSGSSSSNLTGYTSARNSIILMRSASKSGNPLRCHHSQGEF